METKILLLEHSKTQTVPTYGGTKTEVFYTLKTVCENIINEYEITAEIKGIESTDLFFMLVQCTPLNNNETTLTFEGVQYLLNW